MLLVSIENQTTHFNKLILNSVFLILHIRALDQIKYWFHAFIKEISSKKSNWSFFNLIHSLKKQINNVEADLIIVLESNIVLHQDVSLFA